MATTYQLQCRYSGSDGWHTFNAHSKYDLIESKEKAIELLKDAKEFHRNREIKWVEYRIVEIKYTIETVYKDRIGKWTLTVGDLAAYEKKHGTESAIGFLLLTGPDRFEGDYDKALRMLEEREEK